MFSLPIMEPSLGFTNVKVITVPTAIKLCKLLWIFESDLGGPCIRKERFNKAGVLKNYVLTQLREKLVN